MLGIGALFLLFVLLYSQRVASQSCETLGELLHHPMQEPLKGISFNLALKENGRLGVIFYMEA